MGVVLHGATVWTTDTLYRKYPEEVTAWRTLGATVVNMDTAPFYAVSRVVGLSAACACVVSDGIEAPTWDDGRRDIHHARECSKTSSSRCYPGYWDNSPLASSAVSS